MGISLGFTAAVNRPAITVHVSWAMSEPTIALRVGLVVGPADFLPLRLN